MLMNKLPAVLRNPGTLVIDPILQKKANNIMRGQSPAETWQVDFTVTYFEA